MNTIIIDANRDFNKSVDIAVEFLNGGEVIAFPTETVYGIGAGIDRIDAAKKIYSLKKRPPDRPLTAYLEAPEHVERVALSVPDCFFELAEVFLPGPLAVVLSKLPDVDKSITGGFDTIAVRVPNSRITRRIIKKYGKPLVGTSANVSGAYSMSNAEDVFKVFSRKIPLVVDAGVCPIGLESTVISLIGRIPKLIRAGAVPTGEIEDVLNSKLLV